MNQASMKIGVALKEGQPVDEGWVNGVIDAARRSLRIPPLNLNVNADAKVVSILIDGRQYRFMEECFDNDEAVIKRTAVEIANQGIPVYYGNVYFRVPAIQHIFKKSIVMFASTPSRSDGYAVARSVVDMQCGLEFPTAMFSDNPARAVFTPLDMQLPMSYAAFMQTINNKVAVNFPGARFYAGSPVPRAEAKFIEDFLVLASKASKLYPIDMIWTDETIPLPIQNMMQKVSIVPVSAFQFIDRDDAARLNISRHFGRVSMIEAEGNAVSTVSNMINDIGNLIQPGTAEDFADALRSLLANVNNSKFRGHNFNVQKISPSQLIIEMSENPASRQQRVQSRRQIQIDHDDEDA